MKRFGILAVVLAVVLAFVPVWAAEESAYVCSPWAESVMRNATFYNIARSAELSGDMTEAVTPQEFLKYVNSTYEWLKRQYEYYGNTVEPYTPALPEGDTVTREAAAGILAEMAELFGMRTDFPAPQEFADWGDISADRIAAMETVTQMRLMHGDENRRLEPHRALTREEMFALLSRLFLSRTPESGMWDKSGGWTTDDRRKVAEDRYAVSNTQIGHWLENGDGEIVRIFWSADSGEKNFFTDSTFSLRYAVLDGRLYAVLDGALFAEGERIYGVIDTETLEWLCTVPYSAGENFCCASLDGKHLLFEATRYAFQSVDSAYSVYSVYDMNGEEIVPLGAREVQMWSDGWLRYGKFSN